MQPISVLNLFPTRSARQPGDPDWNPNRRPKGWADPDALFSTEEMVVYDKTFAGFDSTGNPKWKRLFLTPQEAATVNIAPTGEGSTNITGADQPAVPCPMRELEDDEVVKPAPGPMGHAAPQVWKTSELISPEVGFTLSDRDLLIRIGKKVGA